MSSLYLRVIKMVINVMSWLNASFPSSCGRHDRSSTTGYLSALGALGGPVEDALVRRVPGGDAVDDELVHLGIEAVVRGIGIADREQGLVGHAAERAIGDVDEVGADRGGALAESLAGAVVAVVDDEVVDELRGRGVSDARPVLLGIREPSRHCFGGRAVGRRDLSCGPLLDVEILLLLLRLVRAEDPVRKRVRLRVWEVVHLEGRARRAEVVDHVGLSGRVLGEAGVGLRELGPVDLEAGLWLVVVLTWELAGVT